MGVPFECHSIVRAAPFAGIGIELPDSQSVDVDRLELCILESENSLPHMAAPTVLYLTPSGEIRMACSWSSRLLQSKGPSPRSRSGEVCLTLTCASACVGVCLTSTGRVISISFDYNASDASPFSCCEIASPQAEIKNAKELRQRWHFRVVWREWLFFIYGQLNKFHHY